MCMTYDLFRPQCDRQEGSNIQPCMSLSTADRSAPVKRRLRMWQGIMGPSKSSTGAGGIAAAGVKHDRQRVYRNMPAPITCPGVCTTKVG